MSNESNAELQEALALKAAGAQRPDVHAVIGWALKNEGRLEEAILEFGAGLALAPEDLSLLVGVGFSLMALGRQGEAARVFEAAMQAHPASPDARYGYGWAAENLGALSQAQAAWEQTLVLKSDHADALAGLAGLAARRRDWTAAKDAAGRALSIDPQQMDAAATLARVELGEGEFKAAEGRLRRLMAMPKLNPEARANAGLLLGDALDGAGRRADAFAAYQEAKAGLRSLYAASFAAPGVPTAEEGARRLLHEFQQTDPADWRASGTAVASPARTHAFLLGFPRSGTTLLETILGSHPEAATLEERATMIKAEAEFLPRPGGLERLAGVLPGFLDSYREDYWDRVRAFGVEPRDKVFVDKHPISTIRLPLIHKLFPEAKILFAVRDPRDVVFSCFRRGFKMNPTMFAFTDLMETAQYYAAAMEAGATYRAALGLDLLQIRYEDLVSDFEGQVRAFCAFLGLSWTDDLTDFASRARAGGIATPSGAQVARGLYTDGVGQWRDYADQMQPVLPILAPWVEAFGYAP